MPEIYRVSLREEPVKDEPAKEGVVLDNCPGLLANGEEVGVDVVAAVVEGLQPFLEGFEHRLGRDVG